MARSTFRSQNVENTLGSGHFWKLRCRKSACRCGAKRVSKSKCRKHIRFGPLLEVEMSKKCMPLWREAHLQVKKQKTPHVRTPDHFWKLGCRKIHAVVARSTFRSQNVKNTRGSDHFWKLGCRFAWPAQGIVHLVKSEQTVKVLSHFQLQPPLHHTTLQYTTLTVHYTQLHYTTLHHATLHYTTPHHTTTTLDYTTYNYNYNILQLQLQLEVQLQYSIYITLQYTVTTLHYNYNDNYSYTYNYSYNYTTLIALQYTTLHYTLHTTLHHTTLHYTQFHYTTLPYPTLQYIT